MELLDPDAVLRSDAAAVAIGRTRAGHAALKQSPRSRCERAAREPRSSTAFRPRPGCPAVSCAIALLFTFSADRIATIEAVAEPERLATLDLVVAGDAWT